MLKMYRQGENFRKRSYHAIRAISIVTGLGCLSGILVYLILGFTLNSSWFTLLIPLGLLLLLFGFIFFYVRPDSLKRIRVAGNLSVIAALLAVLIFQLLFGALTTIVIAYLWIVLLGVLTGFDRKGVIILGVLSTLFPVGVIVAESQLKLYKPILSIYDQPLIQSFVLLCLIGIIVFGVVMLFQTLTEALIQSEERAYQFRETTEQLIQTNQFGQQVSFSLSTIVSELNATSRQQASGAQEQAAAVMEVTSSLTELGETARQIAANSNRVSVAASDGLYSAGRVKEATQRATNTADRGQVAVDSSIRAIEDVRNGITGLAERLMILTERSKQISSIIALIKEIADETHLLALNAAIESAGSGENGRRFAVVASEVKSLADRSLEATTEVTQVINELQGAVAAAVLASEETRKKTFGAVERSYQAGQVITELGQVVDETTVSSAQIVDAVQQVATLAEEIRLATQQQESAIRQIIGTMESVGMVAQENASAVTQVSETVGRIDNLSLKLKEALDSAASLTAAAA